MRVIRKQQTIGEKYHSFKKNSAKKKKAQSPEAAKIQVIKRTDNEIIDDFMEKRIGKVETDSNGNVEGME